MNRSLLAFLLLGLLFATLACGYFSRPEPTVIALRDPFTMEITSEDGAYVSWEGYTDGFYPGVIMTTPLGAKNNSERPWSGKVCVSLLEPHPSDVVFPLAETEFTLASGEGFEENVPLQLPDNLPPGTYALTLVVQQPAGPSVSVTPIQVGEGGKPQPVDIWPTEAALEACR